MGLPPLLPEYTPQGVDLYLERSNFIGLVLAGVAYGVLATIAFQCVLLIQANRARSAGGNMMGRNAPWLLYYTIVMFILATLGFAGNTRFVELTYIDYRNIPGGPNAFTFMFYAHDSNMMGFASYVLMSWCADGLVLYRFSLLYNFKWWIIAFPALVYLGIIGMSVALMVAIRVGGTFWGPMALNFGISYWSLSIALNLGLTLLIAGRLFLMRSRIQAAIGKQHSTPYVSVMSMLIESAALYSSFGLMFIIFYARHSTVQNFILPPLGQVQGIAPLLIIFRVGQGKAWTRETVTATRETTVAFKSGGAGSRTAYSANSYPLSKVTAQESVHVGKSTIITHDDHVVTWPGETEKNASMGRL